MASLSTAAGQLLPTATQLVDELVNCCTQTWRSNGTFKTLLEGILKDAKFNPEGGLQLGPDPGGAAVSSRNFTSYLWVPFDDTPPLGQKGDSLRLWRRNLDEFLLNHSQMAMDVDSLIDKQINDLGLVDAFGSGSLEGLNRSEKVKLLTQYCLIVTNESQSQLKVLESKLTSIKLFLFRINWEEKFIFEEQSFSPSMTYGEFLPWLKHVENPLYPGISNWSLHDSITNAPDPAPEAMDEDAMEALKCWHKKDKLSEQNRSEWSYALSTADGSRFKIEKKDNWHVFENAEQFKQLVETAEDSNIRPVFMRTHLLEEARDLENTRAKLSSPEHKSSVKTVKTVKTVKSSPRKWRLSETKPFLKMPPRQRLSSLPRPGEPKNSFMELPALLSLTLPPDVSQAVADFKAGKAARGLDPEITEQDLATLPELIDTDAAEREHTNDPMDLDKPAKPDNPKSKKARNPFLNN